MIGYLFLCAFMVPVNMWAALTPHLNSETSMRLVHLVSTLVLIPVLITLWKSRLSIVRALAVLYAIFMVVMVVVNAWIAVMGMGVEKGWLDHIFLAIAASSVIFFYFVLPDSSEDSSRVTSG